MSDHQTTTDWVTVGQLGASYGIYGWIKLLSFTDPAGNIFDYLPWHLSTQDNVYKPVEIEAFKPHGDRFIVKVKGYDTPEAVAMLRNHRITIPHSQLPPLADNEFYWSDLTDLTVINREGVRLGLVDHLFETGANDVMVVKGKKEHLIPFVLDHYILEIDFVGKIIRVDWDPNF